MNDTRTKKILIAEDEKFYSKTLSYKLQNSHFDVRIANNGEEAIEALKKEQFDLMLLDLIMPRMNGFDVLEEIKKMNITVPVIVLTNLSQTEDTWKALEMGAVECIVKSDTLIADVVQRIKVLLKMN